MFVLWGVSIFSRKIFRPSLVQYHATVRSINFLGNYWVFLRAVVINLHRLKSAMWIPAEKSLYEECSQVREFSNKKLHVQ